MAEPVVCAYCGKGVNAREKYWVHIEPVNKRLGPYHWRCAFDSKTDIELGHQIAPLGVPRIKVAVLLELIDR